MTPADHAKKFVIARQIARETPDRSKVEKDEGGERRTCRQK